MALIKKITLENGISVNYHRIVSITNIVNNELIVEIASYTSKSKRDEEKDALKKGTKMDVFIKTKFENFDYSENLTVSEAYEYIKQLERFESAKDDI